MRALKTILIILLALVALVILLGFLGPKTTVVERSTNINAPVETVYPHVSSLKETWKWSPWRDLDKDQKTSFSGTPATVGELQEWVGDTVGTGSQVITELEPGKHVGSVLKFTAPLKSEAKIDLDLSKEGDGTKVTWKMTAQNDFKGRILNVFMDMESMVGKPFEDGLTTLKTQVEAIHTAKAAELAAKTFGGYVIETIDQPAMTFIGKRSVVPFKDLQRFFGSSYAGTGAALGKAQVALAGSPSALYYTYDMENMKTDVLAGFPIKAGSDLSLTGFVTYNTPASRALIIPYVGPYSGSDKPHYAMDEMIKAKGLTQHGAVIEEYVTGPSSEPDSTKWLTNIIYLIK